MAKTPTINSVLRPIIGQTYKIMDQITSVTIFYKIFKVRDTNCRFSQKIITYKNFFRIVWGIDFERYQCTKRSIEWERQSLLEP